MTHVRAHTRSKPFETQRIAMTDRLWNELTSLQCVKALESELSKLLPEASRGDIERIEETF